MNRAGRNQGRCWVMAWMGVLASCSASAPQQPAQPAPEAAKTSLVVVPPPPATPVEAQIPDEPEGIDTGPFQPGVQTDNQQKLAFLSTICRVATKEIDGKTYVGCTWCPPFETPETKPNGKITANPDDFYELEILVYGSFTKPDAMEASATFNGCEPYAGNYGGTLLAEKKGKKWAAVRYDSGVHPSECQSIQRADKRDILVCRWVTGKNFLSHFILTYDFALSTEDDVEKGWENVVELTDSSYGYCTGIPPGQVIVASRIQSFTLQDVNGDNVKDLIVDATYAKGKESKAYNRLCEDLYADRPEGSKPIDPAEALGKSTKHRLEYGWDGSKFAPTVATAKKLKGL